MAAAPERPPIHLRPTAELAERVLLPGDPGRALAVAQDVLEEPRMFNHNRGLWGYTGTAADGAALTVQSTGMGGPSAAIVVEELIDLGARRLIRIGTCGALGGARALGELVVAREVVAADGTSRALGAAERVAPDSDLTAALAAEAEAPLVTVVSTDLFYDGRGEPAREWRAAGAEAVEMEAATVLQVALNRGVPAAVLLAVSDLLEESGERRRLGQEALAAVGLVLGRAGAGAFG